MRKQKKHGKKIKLDELKVIQMDVLSAIDEFCSEHHIHYSLACGTLLGAVRHNGYIPWDDDIDIYILREEYEDLMNLFPQVYKGRYCVKSLERCRKWHLPYAKAYDNRTIVFEDASYSELFGVNIDIFPIDEVPDDEELWLRYNKERRELIKKKWSLLRYDPFTLSPRGFARWLYWGVHKWFHSRRRGAEEIDAFAKKWRGRGSKYVFECCQGLFQKHPFRKDVFEQLKKYPFEDRFFMGFVNYDEYLGNGFGNYMQLPPVEERVSHHSYQAYWK